MSQIQTTTPNAPVGQLSPEVPLGISASLTQNVLQLDSKPLNTATAQKDLWIYLDSFEIKSANPVGAHLWEWNSYEPFKKNIVKNQFKAPSNIINQPTMMHALEDVYWATFANMEYMLKFEPIKVTDSRVEIFLQKDYDGRKSTTPLNYETAATSSYNQENEIFVLDSPETCIMVQPPLFQPQTKMRNNSGIEHLKGKNITKLWPVFLPTTSISLKQQSRFINNSLQPNVFTVNVWILPMIKSMSQFNSRMFANTFVSEEYESINYVPFPWWVSTPINPTMAELKNVYRGVKNNGKLHDLVKQYDAYLGKNYKQEAIDTHFESNIEID